jgi:hypothetical protein
MALEKIDQRLLRHEDPVSQAEEGNFTALAITPQVELG